MGELLTPLDSLFVRLESPRTPMHMGSIGIFEGGPLTGPDGCVRIEELRRRTEERLPLVPKLRRRLSSSPFLVLPRQWEDDPAFDVTAHVRQAAVPPPGTEEQLFELCAEILSWPLDRRRPLWELWLVEGLADGRVVVLEKLHHSVADGLGGVELAAILLDLRRHQPGPVVRPERWRPQSPPGMAELVAGDVLALTRRAAGRALRLAGDLARPRRAVARATAATDGLRSLFVPTPLAPKCSLNTAVGRRRRVAVVRQRLAALHVVEQWAGVTLNDVLLAGVVGGMRALHDARGEPLHDLQVMVPVGYGHDGDPLGNNVSTMVVRLPLDVIDPLACLQRVAAVTRAGKRHHQAQGAAVLVSALGVGLQPGIGAVAGLVQHQPFVNVVVTNVPGPSASLYAMGSRMLEAFPIVPIAGNLSVGVAAFSYHGQLGIGILADRQSCPDVATLADGMEESFRVMVRAARAAGRLSRVRPPGRQPARPARPARPAVRAS